MFPVTRVVSNLISNCFCKKKWKKITTVKTLFVSNESDFLKLLDGRFGGLRWHISRWHHWFTFPAKWRTSEERAQKFQTDKMSLLLTGWREFHCGITNQTCYPLRSGETSPVWNFCSRCPRRHFTRKSVIATRNVDCFSGYRFGRWSFRMQRVKARKYLKPPGARLFGEQGMAHWWEHSPPTSVARVQIPESTPYVGRVCCWFSPLLREVFLRVLRFSPLLKKQHFPIPIPSGIG